MKSQKGSDERMVVKNATCLLTCSKALLSLSESNVFLGVKHSSFGWAAWKFLPAKVHSYVRQVDV